MRYYSPCSDNSISGLCDNTIGCVFGERDDDGLLLRHGCDGAGEENKGKEEGLGELHCIDIVVSLSVLLEGVV